MKARVVVPVFRMGRLPDGRIQLWLNEKQSNDLAGVLREFVNLSLGESSSLELAVTLTNLEFTPKLLIDEIKPPEDLATLKTPKPASFPHVSVPRPAPAAQDRSESYTVKPGTDCSKCGRSVGDSNIVILEDVPKPLCRSCSGMPKRVKPGR